MTSRVLADSLSGAADVLAYIPSPAQGVWQLGPFPLRAYALCIIAGIIVAIWWGERRWRERGGQPGAVLDVAMFAVPFGLIGGRLYHVATDWQKYFGADGNAIDALKIYQGGLGIWGAVAFGAVGAWIGCRIYKIPLPAFGDAVAPAILLAQAIGRLGNWFNQELYGRETEVPWGLEIYRRVGDDGRLDMMGGVSTGVVDKVVHPTFLYELLWNVLVVIALVYVDRRYRIGHGRLFALYVAGYSFGRFFVELMRDDEATHIAGIRINSFTSAVVFLLAIAYFVFATKGRETAEQLQPAAGRPWPWQIGALRTFGAAEAVPGDPDGVEDSGAEEPESDEAEAADSAESKDEAAAAKDSANGGKTPAGEKPEPPATASPETPETKTSPGAKATETTPDPDLAKSSGDSGNAEATARDNGTESGAESGATKSSGSRQNDS